MGFRYIGSKDKLSDILISEIRSINSNARNVIDLMAGTGLFSLALREAGFVVSAVDVMTYSYHHLNVHLFLGRAPGFRRISKITGIEAHEVNSLFGKNNYETILNYLNHLDPIHGYFFNEFSPEGRPANSSTPRRYFTGANASKIDAIRSEIKTLFSGGYITRSEHSLLLHDLIMAANDIANIAGTYGHYLARFGARAKDDIWLYPTKFSNKGVLKGHKVYKGYAEETAPKLIGDVCYIDPPYIKRQYAANYHILETIAREDEPQAIGQSGLRPWRDQYSDFCSKLKIRGAFDKILTKVNCDEFLISYSEDGLLPIGELISFLSDYGKVSRKEIDYKRFRSNNSAKRPTLKEYLIHLQRH